MMADNSVGLFDQWSTTKPFFGTMPTWVSGQDQKRLAAYTIFEQVYWNVEAAFKLVRRGDDSKPVYVPTGKQVVEALHRHLAPDLQVVLDQDRGTDTQLTEAGNFFKDFASRERFASRFTANKRYGIIRGDWLFHVYADPEREEGSRVSLMFLDPASYFPIFNDDNVDEIIGCHIAESYDIGGKPHIRRLTYRKETEQGGPSPIIMTDEIYEVDAWGGPDMDEKRVEVLVEETRLPDPISALPVYHIQNFLEPQNPWGSSELRGMERLIMAINQSVSDEELTLALEGLGVYTTDSGPPIDDEGNELPWRVAPGYVIELEDGKKFGRVEGVSNITPFQDHLKYLHHQLDLGTGTPAIAKGDVDVQLAESGVALAIRYGPLLARASEKELTITDVSSNMLFDLRKWFWAYEPQTRSWVDDIRWLPVYGEKIPKNRQEQFDQVMKLADADPPVVSRQWVRSQLAEIGWDLPDDTEMMSQILEEKELFGKMDADIEGFRIDAEVERVEDELSEDEDGDATA